MSSIGCVGLVRHVYAGIEVGGTVVGGSGTGIVSDEDVGGTNMTWVQTWVRVDGTEV